MENKTENTEKSLGWQLFKSTLRALNSIVLVLLYGGILYNRLVNNINPDAFTMFAALTCLVIVYSKED